MVEVTPRPTPNPNALKFTLDRPATAGRAETFREGSDPSESELGAKIFALGGVINVFLTADFVSVTIDDPGAWDAMEPQIIATIQEHYGE